MLRKRDLNNNSCFYGGIDPATLNHLSACTIVDKKRRIVELANLKTDYDIIDFFAPYKAKLFAIGLDGPCQLPVGLYSCCFTDTAECGHEQLPGVKGRAGERELARRGIGCFFTVKKSFAKSWVSRCVELYRKLSHVGNQVLEVYPYATKKILLGSNIPKKSTKNGLEWLRDCVISLGMDLPSQHSYTHHELDAMIAALTVWLHHAGKTEVLGDDTEGKIIIPKRMQKGL